MPVLLAILFLLGVTASSVVIVPAAGLYGLLVVLVPFARRQAWVLGPSLFVFGLLVGNSLPWGPELRGFATVQGEVVGAPIGRQADLAVHGCAVDGSPLLACAGRVRVAFSEPPAIGSRWVVAGRAVAPRVSGLGGPQAAYGLWRSRIRTQIWARGQRPLDGFTPRPTPPEGPLGLLAAVATGDRRGVSPEAWDILRKTGTAHLLAISGFHVGVVAGTVGGLVHLLGRRLGPWIPTGVPTATGWWAGAAAAIAYAAFAGAPLSAQRAAGMVVLGALGRSFARTLDPWRILAVVLILLLVVDPAAVVAPGFQLSFSAVLGLLRFGGPLQQHLGRLGWVGQGLTASTAATLGTLPAAAWWFQSLSITSPLANLLAIPWMTFGVAPCAAAWTLLPEPLSSIAGTVGSVVLQAGLWVLSHLAVAPLTPAVDLVGAFFLALVFVRPKPLWVGSVLFLGLGLHTRPHSALEVVFFDVGQGDAALVEHPDGTRWLIDGGRSDRLVPALRRRGVRRLDLVVASHGDADHAGGLHAVLEDLDVTTLWVGRHLDHEDLLDTARVAGVSVRVLGDDERAASNAASVVLRAESDWGDVLFTGDIEAAQEAAHTRPAAVLKIPHHGSATSSSAPFLDGVSPSLAVLSVGPNRYGHPHPEVLQRYAERAIPVARTDTSGTLRVRLDEHGVRYGATGPFTWFSLDRLAIPRNTTTAKMASAMLMPWLYDSSGPKTSGRK